MTRGEAAQPAALCAARRRKLGELLGFVLAFLLFNTPHVALQLSPRLRRDLPCESQVGVGWAWGGRGGGSRFSSSLKAAAAAAAAAAVAAAAAAAG